MLASVAPSLTALYRTLNPGPQQTLEVPASGLVRAALDGAESSSVQLWLTGDAVALGNRIDSLSYDIVLRSAEQELWRQQGTSAIPMSGSMEIRGPVIDLPSAPAQVRLEAVLPSDLAPGALSILVRYDPPRFAVSFVNTAVIGTLGILLVLIGALQWARTLAAETLPDGDNAMDTDARIWCMWCHLGALAGYLLPFAHILLPLFIWTSRRRRHPGVDQAGRESLDFQFTVTVFALICILLSVLFVGVVMLFVLVVAHVALTLRAALLAQRGIPYRYPFNIRILGSEHP